MANEQGNDQERTSMAAPVEQPEPLNTVLKEAVSEHATDVHIDVVERQVVVRFRVDGMLRHKQKFSLESGRRLMNQVKVAAKLDVERIYSPVESQIAYRNGQVRKHLRVTVVPTWDEESVHLRVLSVPADVLDLGRLGFGESDIERIQTGLRAYHGLVLVAGPTGAGKTTTVYSLLSYLKLESKIAVSIEDPIEFDLPYLRQMEVDERHGLSMSEGLRTILRMDPDVMFVGEIRDRASAVTASHAALAGRLVMATIHGQDAAAAIEAMHRFSVPYHILGDTLRLVISQNLVGRACSDCRTTRPLFPQEKKLFVEFGLEAPEKVIRGAECRHCVPGRTRGRIGVFETVLIDQGLSRLISSGVHPEKLREAFRKGGIRSIALDALTKVAEGKTTLDEVLQFYWPGNGEEQAEEAARVQRTV